MTTLLTGATGLLGHAVLTHALALGVRSIRCLVRSGASRRKLQNLQASYGREAIEIAEGTLLNSRDIRRALHGAERVIHLAASMRGAPADMFLNTVVGSRNLYVEVGRSSVERLVVASTIGVYGLADYPTDRPVTESVPLDPFPERRDVYTYSKIEQEHLLTQLVHRRTLTTIVLRPGPLYGGGFGALPSRIGLQLSAVLVQLGARTPLPLCYVDNCAEAVRLAAFDERVRAGAYNVVDAGTPTPDEYVARYRAEVRPLIWIRLPFAATEALAELNSMSHRASDGQVPLVLTPYRARNLWRGHRYDTARLSRAGWVPPVPTHIALDTAFREWRDAHLGRTRTLRMTSP